MSITTTAGQGEGCIFLVGCPAGSPVLRQGSLGAGCPSPTTVLIVPLPHARGPSIVLVAHTHGYTTQRL